MSDASRLLDHTVSEFARRLASGDPTPGGGSAAALCAALGASLVAMVARLTVGRPAYTAHQAEAERGAEHADVLAAALLELIETDAAAYDAVVRARRMPHDDAAAAERRSAALRSALAGAIDAPLRIASLAADALALAEQTAAIGNRNALSDVAVAADLAWAGLRGGLANVTINLPGLAADDPLRAELAPRIAELEQLAARGVEPVRAALAARETA